MKYQEFSNITIVPFYRLLAGSPTPIMGGPIYPNEHPTFVRHCRRGQPVDVVPQKPNQTMLQRLKGSYIYGGPITNHFGHFFAEFAHRLWVCSLEEFKNLPILFVGKRNTTIPSFFYEYLDLLGIENWFLIENPTWVDRLIVGEQGKQLGTPPREDYIKILDQIFRKNNLHFESPSKKLAVLRPHIHHGRIIGESFIESVLEKNGYTIFRPENYSLKQQITNYLNAEKIVFSEGSSIHLFDIMPKTKSRVFVIKRRRSTHFIELSLKDKTEYLYEYKEVNVIYSLANRFQNSNGLSYVNHKKLLHDLFYYGFIKKIMEYYPSKDIIKQDIFLYVKYWLPQKKLSDLERYTKLIYSKFLISLNKSKQNETRQELNKS